MKAKKRVTKLVMAVIIAFTGMIYYDQSQVLARFLWKKRLEDCKVSQIKGERSYIIKKGNGVSNSFTF